MRNLSCFVLSWKRPSVVEYKSLLAAEHTWPGLESAGRLASPFPILHSHTARSTVWTNSKSHDDRSYILEPCVNGDTSFLWERPNPHSVIKLKPHKKHIFKSIVTVFYYSTGRMSLWAKWAVFLQVTFQMSTFCTDTEHLLHSHRFLIKILSSKLNTFYLN